MHSSAVLFSVERMINKLHRLRYAYKLGYIQEAFARMSFTGVVCRLQTCRWLAPQWFDSTFRAGPFFFLFPHAATFLFLFWVRDLRRHFKTFVTFEAARGSRRRIWHQISTRYCQM